MPEDLASVENPTFEDVRSTVETRLGLRVEATHWFSTYHVHHRVADHFRQGRVFIAGDAGHVHSPAGGQGMNTGIGDAANLAWKLAAVVSGRGNVSLLDSYEGERIAFARSLVATTDKLFQVMVGRERWNDLVRTLLVPNVVPFLLGFEAFRKAAFRVVSQTRVRYRGDALAVGSAGDVHGGDRLPWVEPAANFDPLCSIDWQIHVYGDATSALRTAATEMAIPVHTFAFDDSVDAVGLKRDALYLLRPDGYVALADSTQDVATLRAFVQRFGIRARGA